MKRWGGSHDTAAARDGFIVDRTGPVPFGMKPSENIRALYSTWVE
jgi:hypothetical protein